MFAETILFQILCSCFFLVKKHKENENFKQDLSDHIYNINSYEARMFFSNLIEEFLRNESVSKDKK